MNNYQNGQPYRPQPQGARLYKGQYYSEEQLQPISPWAYFGYSLLFSIPFIGFVCLIILSISDTNINRRNYARSFWCGLVIALAILAVTFVVVFATGGFATLIEWFRNGMNRGIAS
ncbi:MAG: hypothetical protein IKS28_07840 [Clostridia bacterium]|nr:hypothetical protein [Clostridia bacterium]